MLKLKLKLKRANAPLLAAQRSPSECGLGLGQTWLCPWPPALCPAPCPYQPLLPFSLALPASAPTPYAACPPFCPFPLHPLALFPPTLPTLLPLTLCLCPPFCPSPFAFAPHPSLPPHLLALQEVVGSDPQLSQGCGRMLVFARDVASANATAEQLRGVGPPVLLFHREVPQVGGGVVWVGG